MGRLENSVAKLDRETDVDLRSPAGKDLARPVMLEQFWRDYADMAQLSPRMKSLEEAEAQNAGSKSMNARWDERRQDILNFYGDTPDDWDRSRLERATARVANRLRKGSLQVLTLEEVYERSPKNTMWGLPHMSSNPTLHSEYIERARHISSPDELFPAVGGTRLTARKYGERSRNRLVWMGDHAEVLFQLQLFYPVMDAFKDTPVWAAFGGPVPVSDVIAGWLSERTFTSADYSRWDSTLHPALLDSAATVLKHWFSGEDARIGLSRAMITDVGVVTPDGIYVGRDRGMPSGSGSTIGYNSLCHAILVEYVADGEAVNYMVFGDDMVSDWSVPAEEVERVVSHFGMVMNAGKSDVEVGALHFLQNLYEVGVQEGRGRRSLNRTLLSMSSYEYFKHKAWNKFSDTMRYIMQVEECRYHEQFPALFDWLYDHDKVLKDHDLREVIQGAGGLETVEEQRGYSEHHRFGVSSLDSFATVKLWRERRR